MIIQTPDTPTCDVCDQYGKDAHVVSLPFVDYGGLQHFCGQAVTLKTNDDNTAAKDLLTSPGNGRVLIVDNAGNMSCAMVGGNLAKWGAENSWIAIIVNGAIRDRHELCAQPIAVKALCSYPQKSSKGTAESHRIPVELSGTLISDGMWITGDLDGLIVTDDKPTL